MSKVLGIDSICNSCYQLVNNYCFLCVPSIELIKASKKCPCRTCLVKVMCRNICEPRMIFYKKDIDGVRKEEVKTLMKGKKVFTSDDFKGPRYRKPR